LAWYDFFFILEDVLHNTNSRSNLFKEGKDDTNQVRPEFDLNMSTSQFREIEHIFQTVHWKSLKFYREILDTWKYIFEKYSSRMEFGNILFHRIEVIKQILSKLPNQTFMYCVGHIWSCRWNVYAFQAILETRHPKFSNHIC